DVPGCRHIAARHRHARFVLVGVRLPALYTELDACDRVVGVTGRGRYADGQPLPRTAEAESAVADGHHRCRAVADDDRVAGPFLRADGEVVVVEADGQVLWARPLTDDDDVPCAAAGRRRLGGVQRRRVDRPLDG